MIVRSSQILGLLMLTLAIATACDMSPRPNSLANDRALKVRCERGFDVNQTMGDRVAKLKDSKYAVVQTMVVKADNVQALRKTQIFRETSVNNASSEEIAANSIVVVKNCETLEATATTPIVNEEGQQTIHAKITNMDLNKIELNLGENKTLVIEKVLPDKEKEAEAYKLAQMDDAKGLNKIQITYTATNCGKVETAQIINQTLMHPSADLQTIAVSSQIREMSDRLKNQNGKVTCGTEVAVMQQAAAGAAEKLSDENGGTVSATAAADQAAVEQMTVKDLRDLNTAWEAITPFADEKFRPLAH